MYGLALDASKAFDRVEFHKLFECLLKRNVNLVVVRFLLNMYLNQNVRVKFNQSCTDFFHVTNGVKQGGVLSPILFSVYIDVLLESLQKSGYGCRIGDQYVGCISYADDIIILTASLFSLDKMIKVCEKYAKEFQVKFNGTKSKLIVFQKGGTILTPNVFVNSEKVEVVNELNYLGFMISNKPGDTCLTNLIKDFNCKFNSFLGNFNQLTSSLKNKLFSVYCTSYYGSHLCNLKNVEDINIQWRKAIRRVWGLPYRAHNNLLYHICKYLPPEIDFYKRFVKYYFNAVKSDNKLISHIFRSAMTNDSMLGSNIRFILHKFNVNVNSVLNDVVNIQAYLVKKIVDDYKNLHNECDKRVGEHILDLIGHWDSLEIWLLNKKELQDVIDMLATG